MTNPAGASTGPTGPTGPTTTAPQGVTTTAFPQGQVTDPKAPNYTGNPPGEPPLPGTPGYKAPEAPTISLKDAAKGTPVDMTPILNPKPAPTAPDKEVQVRDGEWKVSDVPGEITGALPPGSVVGKTVDNQFVAYIPYAGAVHRVVGDVNAPIEQIVPKVRTFFQAHHNIGVAVR